MNIFQKIYYKSLYKYLLAAFAIGSIPIFAFAQDADESCSSSIETLKDIIDLASCILVRSVVPLLFVIATAMFVWGVVKYVINPEQSSEREKGRQFIMWGLIGLFVMTSVWALVQILRNTFGITNPVTVPVLLE